MGNELSSSNGYSLLEQENIVESILFMMGESVSVDTLATAIESTVDVAKAAADRLYDKYQNEYQDRGMKVIKLGSKYQMVSNNKYFRNLVLVASHPQKPVITESILETLSIIAYKQPISKPEIEHIRGVKSDYACNRLLEYGLIEEKGRLETAGRPILFGTTEEFMLRFGIESLDDLPILDATKFAEIESEVEKELTETLGETVIVDKNNAYTEDVTGNGEQSEQKIESEDGDSDTDGIKDANAEDTINPENDNENEDIDNQLDDLDIKNSEANDDTKNDSEVDAYNQTSESTLDFEKDATRDYLNDANATDKSYTETNSIDNIGDFNHGDSDIIEKPKSEAPR